MNAIIGRKIGMSRIFKEDGQVVPVTLISAQENIVTQVKVNDKDGYSALQLVMPSKRKMNQPEKGHLSKAGVKTGFIKEFVVGNDEAAELSQKMDLSQFTTGDVVNVSAISKGKGFAGTIKRHGFHLGPKTHGGDNYREPGSIGPQQPQRVIKGRRMAGHMGHEKVTVKNLKVADIDTEKNVIALTGAVPGPKKAIVYIWSK